jgi:multiple sugar transport system permease protein
MQLKRRKETSKEKPKKTRVDYNRWGYRFLIPFIVVYFVFSLIPLLSTFYYSFFEYRQQGLSIVGPNFIGFQNYVSVFQTGSEKLFRYFGNTMIMWILGFIPQLLISLLFALWFTSIRLKIKGSSFYKTVMYMPNLVMAAAFSMLFMQLFGNQGPIETLLINAGVVDETFSFVNSSGSARGIIASMNFIMWFGNTTILLMAGIMGIDQTLIESAQMDGASPFKVFIRIILPLLKPILLFVLVTSLIGGIQMFDIPYIFSQGDGGPNFSTMTIMMYLSKLLGPSKQLGLAGAVSVIVFIITGILSFIFFKFLGTDNEKEEVSRKNPLKIKKQIGKIFAKFNFIEKHRERKYENRLVIERKKQEKIQIKINNKKEGRKPKVSSEKILLIVQRVIVYTVFTIFVFVIVFIFYLLILNATKSNTLILRGFNTISDGTFFENSKRFLESLVFQDNFFTNLSNLLANQNLYVGRALLNSIFISLSTALLTTYFSAMTAYAIHLYKFKGRKAIYTFILVIMMIPAQIASSGLIAILFKYNLLDNYWVLIIPSIAAPATFFFIKQYMDSVLPFEVIESARVDGSSELHTFHRLVLPMISPAIAVQFIFSFVASWNNFYLPSLIITSPEKKTIPIVISLLTSSSPDSFDLGPVYMLMVIAIVPMLVIYLVLSKKIISGVTLGSVKG